MRLTASGPGRHNIPVGFYGGVQTISVNFECAPLVFSRHETMDNRYKEVFLTYLRPAISSVGVQIWIGLCVWVFVAGDIGNSRSYAFLSQYIGTLLAAGMLWTHLSRQLTDPQRALIPNFIRWHVAVFLTFAVAVTVALPAISIASHGGGHFGVFAIAIFLFGGLGVVVAFDFLPAILIPIAGLPLVGAVFWHRKGDPATLDGWLLALLLLSVGIGATAFALRLLATKPLMEGRRFALSNYADSVSVRVRNFTRWALPLSEKGRASVHLPCLCQPPSEGNSLRDGGGEFLRALRRWHAAGLLRPAPAIIASLILVLPVALALGAGKRAIEIAVVIDLPFAILIPPIYGRRWLELWPATGTELLRPTSRGMFIRSIGIAICAQVACACMTSCIALMSLAFVGGGITALLRIGPWIGIAILAQPIVCVVFWAGLRKPGLFSGLLSALLAVCTMAGFGIFPELGPLSSALLAAGIAAAGLVLTRLIYRQWLNMEFG